MKKEIYTLMGLALLISALILPYFSSTNTAGASIYDTGVTVNAKSGSAADIQAAVNQANSAGGGVVNIPAGTWHWNGGTVTVPGGVSLHGASPAGCAGHEDNWKHYTATTIIINDAPQPIANPTIILDGTSGKNKPSELYGLRIEAGKDPTSESTSGGSWGIEIKEAKNYRISYCDIINFNHNQIAVNAGPNRWSNEAGHSSYGLIDHCFLDAPYKDNGLGAWGVAYGIDVFGNMQPKLNNWKPFTKGNYAGKYQAFPDVSLVYIEDCNFRRLRHEVDTENGGVACVRYCLFDHLADEYSNLWSTGTLCQHPYWTGSQYSGALQEIYNNRFVNTGTTGDPIPYPPSSSNPGNMHRNCPRHPNQKHGLFAIVARGGSMIIHDNEYYQPESSPNSFGVFCWLRDESTAPPTGSIMETYIWAQTSGVNVVNSRNPIIQVDSDVILNTDYFLRQPNSAQDGWDYTPYTYPHPHVSNEPVPTPTPTGTPTPTPTSTPTPTPTPTSTPTPTPTPAPIYTENLLWRDDFNTQNSRWSWSYSTGTGFNNAPVTVDGLVCAAHGIGVSSSSVYSDSSIHTDFQVAPTDLRVLRTYQKRDYNSDPTSGEGTWGIGFWDGTPSNLAWFFWASQESSADLRGLRAMVISGGSWKLNELITDVDLSQWHTFEIYFLQSRIEFYIDGVLKSSVNARPTGYLTRLEACWIDNGLMANTGRIGNLATTTSQRGWIDYLEWASISPTPTPTPTSTPTPTPSPYPTPTATPTPTPSPTPTPGPERSASWSISLSGSIQP